MWRPPRRVATSLVLSHVRTMPPRAKRRDAAGTAPRGGTRSAPAGRLVFTSRADAHLGARAGAAHARSDAETAPPRRPSGAPAPEPTPPSSAQLAVHKRKVADVRGWLTEALRGPRAVSRFRRILALTGPSGTGKTATVRALAARDELDYEVVEWENEASFYEAGDRLSAAARFTEFLKRAVRYPSLPLATAGATAPSAPRKVVLVEDLPNLAHDDTRAVFHTTLEQFVNGQIPSAPHIALVLVVSDTVPRADMELWAAGSEASDWRARRASVQDVRTTVPEAVRLHPAFAEIRFNPATNRMIQGALSSLGAAPSAALTARIADAAGGDVRNAINLYSFIAASAPRKRTLDGTRKNADVSELLGSRESAMVLFHALGRVLYNKRLGDPDEAADAAPAPEARPSRVAQLLAPVLGEPPRAAAAAAPPWLAQRRPSRVDVEQLWGSLPVDAGTFLLYLYHNLPQYTDDVDEFAPALDALSSADALLPRGEAQLGAAATSAMYGFHVATRGTLLALPSPVPRRGQAMTKPAFWDLARRLQEHEADLGAAGARLGGRAPATGDGALLRRVPALGAVGGASAAELASEVLPLAAKIDARFRSTLTRYAERPELGSGADDEQPPLGPPTPPDRGGPSGDRAEPPASPGDRASSPAEEIGEF